MNTRVRKALLPVAGLGTRFLPATKAVPKEMLPIVDKPLIQYAVEEAVDAGIDQIIFVTSRQKRSIEDHFDRSPELELLLHLQDRHDLLTGLNRVLPPHVRYSCVRQGEPLGLGHAVACAADAIGNEPFAVMLPDDLMDARPPAIGQLIDQFQRLGHSIVAVEAIDPADTRRYGIVETVATKGPLRCMIDIEEKPHPSVARSNLAVVGRYVFTPEIFARLDALTPGAGGELQLTDAIRALLSDRPVSALEVDCRRFDCGSKLGFMAATLHFGLHHPEIGRDVARLIGEIAMDEGRSAARNAVA